MNELGAEQARKRLPQLLDRAHRGETTIITKHGKPYAAVVPLDAVLPKLVTVCLSSLRGSGKDCWSNQPGRDIAALRDDWD
jgi:prevent-host-death family protein